MTVGRPGDDRPAPFWQNVSELLEDRSDGSDGRAEVLTADDDGDDDPDVPQESTEKARIR